MASHQERLENIKECAEQRSQLQAKCLAEVDLSKLKNKVQIATARYNFENCEKNNLENYPCLVKRETLKYSF
jgi:hypothetical protein